MDIVTEIQQKNKRHLPHKAATNVLVFKRDSYISLNDLQEFSFFPHEAETAILNFNYFVYQALFSLQILK